MPFLTLTYVIAQSTGEWMLPVFGTLKDIGIVVVVVGAVAAIVYSVFNRKKYDGLTETIKEQKDMLDTKNARIKTITEEHKAELAEITLTVNKYEQKNLALEQSNLVLATANLQSAAILKKLRQTGKWDGDESDVFRDSMYDASRK